ncbi:MAG: hypothetical protein ACPF9U_02375 [Flavobacteriaceae bacterium]
MKRLIVDYKKLSEKILNLLDSQYPFGYDDDDIIEFKLASGEIAEAIEVRSEDTVYLIKVGSKLTQIIKENKKNNFEKEDDFVDLKDDNIDDDITT